ncbi:MAG: KEOPS complex kinase/ATPase Bud32 [Methanomassiliicoccales archaeon]|nr:KEOPS complex kinase/ATPase Bud32 [Methanomassiliicoccales archaeon]
MGRSAVAKKRTRKLYRDERLDRKIISQRTRNEARCIITAREMGMHVPRIYDVDEGEGTIVMEFIDGLRLNLLLLESTEKERHEIERKFGSEIAMMHRAGLAHGDLTTSNVVVRNGDLYFLDFSMGTRGADIEVLGVDIRLLKEVYRASHPDFEDEFSIVADAYVAAGGNIAVLQKAREIESRARYT